MVISIAKGQSKYSDIHHRERHRKAVKTTAQRRCLLDSCDDWEVPADLTEWDSHPSIIKETRLRADIVIGSSSTQKLIVVELTNPYKNRMEEAQCLQKRELPELNQRAKRCRIQSRCNARWSWWRRAHVSSVYNPLTKLSIYGNKRTKALKLLAEMAENSSSGSVAEGMRGRSKMIKNALTIRSTVGKVVYGLDWQPMLD